MFGFFSQRITRKAMRSIVSQQLEPYMAMNELILTAVTNVQSRVDLVVRLCDDLKAKLDAQLAIPDGPTSEEVQAVVDQLQSASAALDGVVARDTPV